MHNGEEDDDEDQFAQLIERNDETPTTDEPEKQFLDLTDEQLSYGLLIACSNRDSLMLKYLWEMHGSFFYSLANLKVVVQ